LELVLDDHADQGFLMREIRKDFENCVSHVRHVCACGPRLEDRQSPAVGAFVRERVVEIVEVWRKRRTPRGTAQQPKLLEVADVRQIPHERRLQRRELPRELLVVERLKQGLGSSSRMRESRRRLSR
jgi:hypothetical protein